MSNWLILWTVINTAFSLFIVGSIIYEMGKIAALKQAINIALAERKKRDKANAN